MIYHRISQHISNCYVAMTAYLIVLRRLTLVSNGFDLSKKNRRNSVMFNSNNLSLEDEGKRLQLRLDQYKLRKRIIPPMDSPLDTLFFAVSDQVHIII